MTDSKFISYLEEIGHRAWRARENVPLHGWILRADDGVTRRANSVLPLEFDGTSLDSAINEAIEFYTARDLPVYYQMTEASQPPELDSRLETRGFEKELIVHVQTADVTSVESVGVDNEVVVTDEPSRDWLDCYAQATGYTSQSINVRLKIMSRVRDHRGYALSKVDGIPAAVGFGVVTEEWVGLFGIATRRELRRRGAAEAVSKAIVQWGETEGARRAYLQVETDNEPAINLYRKMGFETVYTYWYRLLNARNK